MIGTIWALITGNPLARALGKAAVVIFGVLTMRALWKRDGAQEAKAKQALKDSKAFKETTERMQDADASVRDDPAALREWLRDRDPKQR